MIGHIYCYYDKGQLFGSEHFKLKKLLKTVGENIGETDRVRYKAQCVKQVLNHFNIFPSSLRYTP